MNGLAIQYAYIKEKYNKPGAVYLGLVHRLDRNVGGVLLFARTSKAAARLSKLFRDHDLGKFYTAIVAGRPAAAQGERVDHLTKDEDRRMARVVKAGTDGAREARLRYRVIATQPAGKEVRPLANAKPIAKQPSANPGVKANRKRKNTQNEVFRELSLVEIEILTGRFHQIRAQLSAMGHPILGDKKYGASHALRNWALTLFASRLVLSHPVRGDELVLEATPEWCNIFTV